MTRDPPPCDWKIVSLALCLDSENDKDPVRQAIVSRQEDNFLNRVSYMFLSFLPPFLFSFFPIFLPPFLPFPSLSLLLLSSSLLFFHFFFLATNFLCSSITNSQAYQILGTSVLNTGSWVANVLPVFAQQVILKYKDVSLVGELKFETGWPNHVFFCTKEFTALLDSRKWT